MMKQSIESGFDCCLNSYRYLCCPCDCVCYQSKSESTRRNL